jgi:hypothetical protein
MTRRGRSRFPVLLSWCGKDFESGRSLFGIDRRQRVQNIHELVHQRLAFDAEQKMLEIVIRQDCGSGCITPQIRKRNVEILLAHTVLD